MLKIFLLCFIFVINKQLFATGELIRGCYFTSWSQYRDGEGRYVPEKYVPGLCTHIYYAFSGMSTEFTLKSLDPNDDNGILVKGMYARVVDLKKIQPGLKVLLSFAGYSFSNANALLLQFMVSSEQTRQKFINSVVNLLVQYGFDGFDVAWLFPSNKDEFTLFLRELKSAFDKQGDLLLTASVSGVPSVIRSKYDAEAIGKVLDHINVISYDFHGPWEKVTGHNSPLFDRFGDKLSIRDAMDEWHKGGVAKSKLIAGLPSYGHGWTLYTNNSEVGALATGPSPGGPFTKEPGVIAYYEVCGSLEKDSVRMYDQLQKSPYLVYNQLWFSYDNRKSFNAKLNWIKENGYGGANVWSLDHDDFNGNCIKDETPKYPLISLMTDVFRLPAPSPTTSSFAFLNESAPSESSNVQKMSENAVLSMNETIDIANTLCETTGFYKDPTSCSRFYSCETIGSKPILANCLFGLLFSEEKKKCDSPSNVRCDI